MKKLFLLFTLVFVLAIFAVPSASSAADLSSLQIRSILDLLSSFGADAATVANVQAILTHAQSAQVTESNTACLSLNNNLSLGSTDGDSSGEVSRLQAFLKGPVTGYFGPTTLQLVQNWQRDHGVVSTGSPSTTGYGSIGPRTRSFMSCTSGGAAIQPTTPPPPITTTPPSTPPTSSTGGPTQQYLTSTASLTVLNGGGDSAASNILVAGSSSAHVAQFAFSSTGAGYTIQELTILVPSSAANSVSSVSLAFKDRSGAAQTATQALIVSPGDPQGRAHFAGLSLYVPQDRSASLDVFVNIPTIASGAVSGSAINVSLETSPSTFKVIDFTGRPSALTNGGQPLASNSTYIIRKSYPTFAIINPTSTVPSTGLPLYRFSIAADPAGAIEWTDLTFNLATSGVSGTRITNVFLTDDATGNSLLDNGTFATISGGRVTVDLLANNVKSKFAQVGASSIKTYDLYGTVSGFTTGSTVTIGLVSDSTATPNASASAVAAVPSNVVWSDRASSAHSVASDDWTNGFSLKNFTTSTVSYSK